MTKQSAGQIHKAGAMLLGASAALLCAVAANAQAGGASPYVTDSGGSVVRNATYVCWHTGFWTPAAAIADCDPDLVARPPLAKRGEARGEARGIAPNRVTADGKGGKQPADNHPPTGGANDRRVEAEKAGTGR